MRFVLMNPKLKNSKSNPSMRQLSFSYYMALEEGKNQNLTHLESLILVENWGRYMRARLFSLCAWSYNSGVCFLYFRFITCSSYKFWFPFYCLHLKLQLGYLFLLSGFRDTIFVPFFYSLIIDQCLLVRK